MKFEIVSKANFRDIETFNLFPLKIGKTRGKLEKTAPCPKGGPARHVEKRIITRMADTSIVTSVIPR